MTISCFYWLFRHVFGLAVLRCRSDGANEVEILVLRHELAVLRRQVARPSCRPADRMFLAALARALPRDRWGSVFVRPETIRRWHRSLLARRWTYPHRPPGRPATGADLRALIQVLLAPHLVNYGFVRELLRRDYTIIEVPVDEYWDLALNGVTLAPGKVLMNAGSPSVVKELERHDVEVIQIDFSESHRFAIAGLHCATLELVRDQDDE